MALSLVCLGLWKWIVAPIVGVGAVLLGWRRRKNPPIVGRPTPSLPEELEAMEAKGRAEGARWLELERLHQEELARARKESQEAEDDDQAIRKKTDRELLEEALAIADDILRRRGRR